VPVNSAAPTLEAAATRDNPATSPRILFFIT
jgi:hypothetical protein